MGVGVQRLWTIAAVLLAGSSAARGQAPAALSWVREPGAESCIGAPELGARVERLVGPVLVAAPSAEVSVEGHIARQGPRFAARIVVSDARGAVLGERELLSAPAASGVEPDCRALDDELAFVIAVAIDPNAALAQLPGELAPEGDPGAELLADLRARPPQPASFQGKPPDRAAEPRAASPIPERLRWHLSAAVGGGLGFEALPAPNGAAVVELGGGVAWFTQRAHVALGPGQTLPAGDARIRLEWLEVGAASCAELFDMAGFGLDLCLGFVAARFTAEPDGFSGDLQRRWLFGPRGAARLMRDVVGPIALALEASASPVWPKHRVAYRTAFEAQEAYRVPAVSGAIRLLIEAHIEL